MKNFIICEIIGIISIVAGALNKPAGNPTSIALIATGCVSFGAGAYFLVKSLNSRKSK